MIPPSKRKLETWDKKYSWHPFTQMKEWREGPMVIIDRGRGNWLIDIHGRRYLDGVSSLWCNVHGHRVKKIDDAVKRQMGRIAHSTFLGLSHVPAIELSKKLAAIAPKGLTKVFYSDSGSAAVEVALKMAYQYWRHKGRKEKNTFLKLTNGYHGDTLGALSVGGIALFHDSFGPLLFKTIRVEAPYAYRDASFGADPAHGRGLCSGFRPAGGTSRDRGAPFRSSEAAYAEFCAARVERVLKKHHRKICALIAEPLMQGAAGMLNQPRGYLTHLRRLTKKYRVLLIADEVATGFGRTGKMFACDHERVSPDFLCLAKGITGGYLPLSATLATDEIYGAFLGDYKEFKAFFHGHTYSANPLACAAALANLEIFAKQGTLKKLQSKIKILSFELSKMRRLPHVGDIRQVGFMVGIELVKNPVTKEPYPLAEKRGFLVALAARERRVIIRPLGNVVVLMPPLSIKESELRMLCRVIYESIREVTEH